MLTKHKRLFAPLMAIMATTLSLALTSSSALGVIQAISTPKNASNLKLQIPAPNDWVIRYYPGDNGLQAILWPKSLRLSDTGLMVFAFVTDRTTPEPRQIENIEIFEEKCPNYDVLQLPQMRSPGASTISTHFRGKCGRSQVAAHIDKGPFSVVLLMVADKDLTQAELDSFKEMGQSYNKAIDVAMGLDKVANELTNPSKKSTTKSATASEEDDEDGEEEDEESDSIPNAISKLKVPAPGKGGMVPVTQMVNPQGPAGVIMPSMQPGVPQLPMPPAPPQEASKDQASAQMFEPSKADKDLMARIQSQNSAQAPGMSAMPRNIPQALLNALRSAPGRNAAPAAPATIGQSMHPSPTTAQATEIAPPPAPAEMQAPQT